MGKDYPKYIKYVAVDPQTASDLCNELYPDEPETVGIIIRDYINYFLYEDQSLIETDCDRYERFVRNQLADDANRLRTHAKEVSDSRAESGRKGGKSKGKRKDQTNDSTKSNEPDEDEVIKYIQAKKYDGNVAGQWLNKMITVGWVDENGKPIRDWRKRLDAYMRGFNRNLLSDMASGMFKG